jgi:hypothetical protein
MRQFERRVSTVRLGIDGSVLNRHFAVAGTLSRAANNVATRTPDPTHLNLVAEAAEAGIGNLLRSLPPWRRDGLAVEAGVVKTTLEGSEAVVSDERDYVLAVASGTVVGMRSLTQPPLSSPWRPQPATWASPDYDLPVLLGPSAALTLAHVACSAGAWDNLTLPSGLVSLGWTAASLLPALDYSFIASEALGEHSFLSVYMSDENAVQPAGALNSSPNRNFVVDCATRVSHPDRACLVESVKHSQWRRGGVLSIRCSDMIESRGLCCCPAEISTTWKPAELFGRVVGSVSQNQLGMYHDDFSGQSFGAAPFLRLDMTLGELLSRAAAPSFEIAWS